MRCVALLKFYLEQVIGESINATRKSNEGREI